MSIIPEKPVTLLARSDADFDQEFAIYDDAAQTQPTDLAGWSFRFRVKASALDDDGDALDVEGAVASGTGITVTANAVRVQIDKLLLAALLPGGQVRLDAQWALQGSHSSGSDACWAAGPLSLVRGL
jgi:hypothetical protein